VSAVTVEKPKQLLATHTALLSLLISPSLPSELTLNIKGSASAELVGWPELLHSWPSTVWYRVNIPQWGWKAISFILPLQSCHLLNGSLTHNSLCLRPLRRTTLSQRSWCGRLRNSYSLPLLDVHAEGRGCRRHLLWQMLPWSFLWSEIKKGLWVILWLHMCIEVPCVILYLDTKWCQGQVCRSC